MVPRDGIEPPTPCSSGTCSTTELPGQLLKNECKRNLNSFIMVPGYYGFVKHEIANNQCFRFVMFAKKALLCYPKNITNILITLVSLWKI